MSRLLTIDQLAERASIGSQTVKNLLSKSPESLPPRAVIPNVAVVRFAEVDVDAWIDGLTRTHLKFGESLPELHGKRRGRGRPRKADSILAGKNHTTK